MPRFSLITALLALTIACGCKGGEVKGQVLPADALARDNPDAKAKLLLDQFEMMPAEERQGWVQRRSAEFTVFETVTDPQLKTRYEKEVQPLLGSN